MPRKVQKIDVSSPKHSDSDAEVISESGSSIGSDRQIYVITRAESGKSYDSDRQMEDAKSISASPRRSYSSSSSESEQELDSQIDVITRAKSAKSNDSDKQMKGTKSISAKVIRSYSSSSSEPEPEPEPEPESESGSLSDDSFQEDAVNSTTSDASNPVSIHVEDYVSSSSVSSENSAKSEADNNPPVPRPTFQAYKVTHNQNGLPPTITPPMQVMDRSGGYDPARIPSSVFERNTTPLEWSVASNESLFSLHIGNVSFNREHAFVFGEFGMPENLQKSGHLNPFSRTPSVIIEEIAMDRIEEVDTARTSIETENLHTKKTSVEAFKLEGKHDGDLYIIKDLLHDTSCTSSKSVVSNLSHESGKSFAFPIFTEAERYNSSVKADNPRQQLYVKESVASGKKSTSSCCCCCGRCCNWFRCFSCPSFTCWKWKRCCRWKPSCTWKLSCTWPKCRCSCCFC